MNLDQIETKCFILALFIRDDGERFLLGSRAYEFVDSQLHFVANSYQNDIVEVQGNDGVMLAGQVRRGTSQPFDGYIGDQTVDRSTIEQYRRDFMKFFRKNHYYKVVYVFPDGSAVQRRNGFIVEAPEVKELYQLFPQYHISMNFEDINYYVYEEDSDGEEIYGESATLKIATSATGGLIWEEVTESEISGEGSQFTLQDTIDGNVLGSAQIKGDTTQQTYSGKNLINITVSFPFTTSNGITVDRDENGWITLNGTANANSNIKFSDNQYSFMQSYNGQQCTVSYETSGTGEARNFGLKAGSGANILVAEKNSNPHTGTLNLGANTDVSWQLWTMTGDSFTNYKIRPQMQVGATVSSYEPYVGGIPAPNPDYPQTVNTVTGRQVVEVYGKNLWNSEMVIGGIGSAGSPLNRNDRFNSATKIKVLPNTTYTFSAIPKTTGKILSVVFQEYNSNGIFTRQNPGNYLSLTPLTITTSADCEYLTLSGRYSDDTVLGTVGDYTDAIQNIQLELGSSATPYESRQSYDVNLGKNLLDPSILIQGDITGGTSTNRVCTRSGDDINVSGGDTYTISVSDIALQVNVYGYKSINGTAIYDSGWQSMPFTFELPSQANYLRLMFRYSNDSDIVPSDITCQLEKGSQTTIYAPYISHFGKNMFDENIADMLVARLNSEGGIATGITNRLCTQGYIPVSPNTTYTFNATPENTSKFLDAYMCGYTEEGSTTAIGNYPSNAWHRLPITFTTGANCNFIRIGYRYSDDSTVSVTSAQNQQLEQGSTTTPYQPFIGGQLELCKIGTYQDYIYKSGDNWYVHKAITSYVFNGSETWGNYNSGTANYYYDTSVSGGKVGVNTVDLYSNYGTGNIIGRGDTNQGIMITSTGDSCRVRYGAEMALSDWKSKLSTTNMTLYFPLATPTDIQITDSSLIAQLEALLGATTYDGQTVFTVTSANQLAILDVTVIARTGGGVVWDNYGAEWEEGTGGGPTMVNVDSIDNVYPVLTLTGPAVNPQISVLTTNTTLSYSGTVTASQELKIDMFNKTATLNGASVVGNVSGDWVYLKPGVNRITYTTNNADAPDSTIWWQEIVG